MSAEHGHVSLWSHRGALLRWVSNHDPLGSPAPPGGNEMSAEHGERYDDEESDVRQMTPDRVSRGNEMTYTPSLSQLREWWAEDMDRTTGEGEVSHMAEFDRLIAAHDAQIREAAMTTDGAVEAAARSIRHDTYPHLDHLPITDGPWMRYAREAIAAAIRANTGEQTAAYPWCEHDKPIRMCGECAAVTGEQEQ